VTSPPPSVDLSRFPWHRPLVTACLREFPTVASLFAGNPADGRAWRDTVRSVQEVERDRESTSRILTEQLTRRGAPTQAREAAVSLADPRTVAVVTGQQAGLFGGPLYTMLKAITAIQLARRLELDQGVRTVPIFWVEAEDHDWKEIRTVHVLDADHNVRDISAPDATGAGQLPIGRLTFDERITGTLSELFAALPPSAFTGDLQTRLSARYSSGAGPAGAFAGWMDDLFGAHGMVVFEGHDPAAKPLAADLFVNELDHPGRTSELVGQAARAMKALGHEPQIEPPADSVAMFFLGGEARRPIKHRGGELIVGDSVHSAAALRAEAAGHPERFSPNVLLRPLVQDRLFPTVCYVAGPSELAYHAELGGVYRAFGIPEPLVMPRVSATLLDSAAVRFLERHHLSVEDLHQPEETALTHLVERAVPADVEEALAAMQEAMAERGSALKDAIVKLDTTLTGAVDTTLDRMRDTLQSLHGKMIQAAKRNDETLRRQFKRTYALVHPGGAPQERTLGMVFFLNRYGPGLIKQLVDTLPLETDRHYVLTL
jgi:bacillithiol biosynthesis cysteine-adding enzyme BshC